MTKEVGLGFSEGCLMFPNFSDDDWTTLGSSLIAHNDTFYVASISSQFLKDLKALFTKIVKSSHF